MISPNQKAIVVGLSILIVGFLVVDNWSAYRVSINLSDATHTHDGHLQIHTDTVPDFCANPTKTSVGSGNWSDANTWTPAGVPSANDKVQVSSNHTVVFDASSTPAIDCVGIYGILNFRTDTNTSLLAGTILVYTNGHLIVGTNSNPILPHVKAEIVIANKALDLNTDPEQYGTGLIGFGEVTMHGAVKTPTFVKTSVEPLAGDTSVSLEQSVSGWRVGNLVFLPDTRMVPGDDRYNQNYQLQVEKRTITNISGDGKVVTLSAPLSYDHKGARDANNTPTILSNGTKLLPHLGNLTRNIIIRSQNPTETRGHTIFTHRADVEILYVQFQDLGRTKAEALDSVTNHIGRYPLHAHHLWGPDNPSSSGYQFKLVGNAVNDSLKWPIAVHASHFGLVESNVVFGGDQFTGAGIALEDGSETENLIKGNFVANIRAYGDVRESGPFDRTPGSAGECIWAGGFNNRFVDNVVSTCRNPWQNIVNGPCFKLIVPPGIYRTKNPNFRGADMSNSSQTHEVTPQHQPILEFRNNECYGIAAQGLTAWNLGTTGVDYNDPDSMGISLIKDFRVWNTYEGAIYNYPANKMHIDGLVYRVDPVLIEWNFQGPMIAYHCGDYLNIDIVIRNSDVHARHLMGNCTHHSGTILVENNKVTSRGAGMVFQTVYTPGTKMNQGPEGIIATLRNNLVKSWPGTTLETIAMSHIDQEGTDTDEKFEVYVYDHQQQSGNNFRVFFAIQATQNIYGGLATCNDTTSRPDVSGITCNLSGNPPPSPTPTPSPSPSPSPTPISSPNPTCASTSITTSEGDVWTLGSNGETLKNGVHVGVGYGVLYIYKDGKVYNQGNTGANWYEWDGTNWAYIGTTAPTCPSSTLLGDLNSDGIVNSLDWSIMNSRWFTSDATADLNDDGIVNAIDFSILNSNWFRTS